MKYGILSSNALKIIAMLAMLLDHTAIILLDGYLPFRIIGRLAYPIFAYMIAEGCFHTRNKLFYLLRVFSLGAVCQAIYYYVDRDLYLNILLTFSVSIPMIYLLKYAKRNAFFTLIFLAAVIGVWVLCHRLAGNGIEFDYGFYGIMFPVFISISENRREKIILAFCGLFLLAQSLGGIQIWSLAALPLLFLYSGRRGKLNMKYTFYLFYPLHLAVLYGISYII